MAKSKRHVFFTVIACLGLFVGSGSAQRPNSASVCDFYAQARYGANSSDTQLKFIQNVVCLAFEGGTKLTNVSSNITGILRPGKFNGVNIDLQQFFNGSKASTNVNNAAIGINWLDQGGTTPLANFLAGETQTLNLANSSNQYHLFGNFFVAFAKAFGCTLPPAPLPNTNGPVSLAYAHKFMNLDNNQLGYFINHLSLSLIHFGASPEDADTLKGSLNSRYNVRCAPAVSFSTNSAPQLLSLCQNPTCPLAAPVSDCAAYANLTAGGSASNPTTVTAFGTQTATPIGGPTSSTTAATSPGSSGLSMGGIAGIAIGGAAVLLIAIIALIFLRRKRRTPVASMSQPPPEAAWNQQNYNSPTLHPSSVYMPKNNHQSYTSTGAAISEMDISRYQHNMDGVFVGAGHDSPAHHGHNPYSGHSSGQWSPPPVEMGIRSPAPQNASPVVPKLEAWQHQQQTTGSPVHGQEQYSQQDWGAHNRHYGS